MVRHRLQHYHTHTFTRGFCPRRAVKGGPSPTPFPLVPPYSTSRAYLGQLGRRPFRTLRTNITHEHRANMGSPNGTGPTSAVGLLCRALQETLGIFCAQPPPPHAPGTPGAESIYTLCMCTNLFLRPAPLGVQHPPSSTDQHIPLVPVRLVPLSTGQPPAPEWMPHVDIQGSWQCANLRSWPSRVKHLAGWGHSDFWRGPAPPSDAYCLRIGDIIISGSDSCTLHHPGCW